MTALVVGAGPSGLMVAAELVTRGVPVRIVEARTAPSPQPRALSVWPRAFEALDALGVGDAIDAAALRVTSHRYVADGTDVATLTIPADCRSRALPQYETERILRERLSELGVEVEWGVAFDELADAGDPDDPERPAQAVLAHADGRREHVRVSALLGADGAGSRVRERMGVGFEGTTYPLGFAIVDAFTEGPLRPDEIIYFQSGSGTLAVIPIGNGAMRFFTALPDGKETLGADEMQRMVDTRGPRGVRLTDVLSTATFRVHNRMAADFRRGRTFLLGDAAHVHSPAGGQGMNNGLQDAHDLAWRLAAVLRGDSPARLLDDYGPERAAAIRAITRNTDRLTRAWMARGTVRTAVRNAVFGAFRTAPGTRLYGSLMAGHRLRYPVVRATQTPSRSWECGPGGPVVGGVLPERLRSVAPGSWALVVVAGARQRGWVNRLRNLVADRPAVRVVAVPPRAAGAAVGCRRPGFHLVRPDGHLAAHGHRDDVGNLIAELDAALLRSPAGPARDARAGHREVVTAG